MSDKLDAIGRPRISEGNEAVAIGKLKRLVQKDISDIQSSVEALSAFFVMKPIVGEFGAQKKLEVSDMTVTFPLCEGHLMKVIYDRHGKALGMNIWEGDFEQK